jgi:hypothetical protein
MQAGFLFIFLDVASSPTGVLFKGASAATGTRTYQQ